MKILAVFTGYPSPPTDGQNLRLTHYVPALATRHRVDLVHAGAKPEPYEGLQGCFGEILHVADWLPPRGRGAWHRIMDAMNPQKLVPSSQTMLQAIRRLHQENSYDVLWVGGFRLMPSVPDDLNIPVLVDECDHDGLTLRRLLLRERRPYRWLRLYKRYRLTLAFERRLAPRARAVLFVAPADRESFVRNCPQVPTHVIPNGVDATFFAPPFKKAQNSGEIVFEGNLSFPPNVDAACHLARDILPCIRRVMPHVHLTLVGQDPSEEIKALAHDKAIEVTGFVSDIRPYLARAQLFACPMRLGSGIKNKILQAWSMGVPIVATPLAVDGLEARDGANVRIAVKPQAFADQVLALLSDKGQRRRMASEGRKTVLAHYTWEAQAKKLESLLTEFNTTQGHST
ncbi:glycosyltransferase family 4 protein [Ectothiorhodospira marina]|uniref:Glycosyltransferase involved in cell wall bisynthesis n=1 Tax=Ectothiorhodospira marina TaxID=1396821 RepID=A0A1H7IEB3_9GAMM|nr:glycosyltransferase family 4 protein [Ectothiorhodospira marina]SEK60192.1 Glycosyltransferase involved in cell wall bisynthesis [Ectothiorhodospira marina]